MKNKICRKVTLEKKEYEYILELLKSISKHKSYSYLIEDLKHFIILIKDYNIPIMLCVKSEDEKND